MSHRIISQLLLAAQPAVAETPIAEIICDKRPVMVQRLTQTFGAQLTATGVRDSEAVMEVWTAPSGNWTLVQSYANGRTCILAMGANWDMAQAKAPG